MQSVRACCLCLAALVTSAGAAGQALTDEQVLAESAEGDNWFFKGGDFSGAHYTPLDQVNVDTVAELGLAWSTNLPIPDGTPTTPIVVDGVIYIGGAYSRVVALDAATGEIRWTFDPDVRRAFEAR